MRRMCPNADEELARWWGERCRAATSPGAARALIEMASLIDVRDVLGAVQAPTLVLHRRDDIDAHIEEGRYLAERIPGARFVELEGTDHFVGVDPDQILDPVEEFVRGLGSSTPTETSLTTLLAVHLEKSIDLAWMRGIMREVLEAHRGVPAVAEQARCWRHSTARARGALWPGARRAAPRPPDAGVDRSAHRRDRPTWRPRLRPRRGASPRPSPTGPRPARSG